MRLSKVLVALFICVLASSCKQSAKTENEPCDGIFYMDMDGFSNKSICTDHLDTYVLDNEGLNLKVMNDELAGKVIFELFLNPWDGPGEYHFGSGLNKCEVIVHGASDEFYKCTSGKILVSEATSNKMEANFSIVIEGFYNKKVLHARGGVHL